MRDRAAEYSCLVLDRYAGWNSAESAEITDEFRTDPMSNPLNRRRSLNVHSIP